jgi:hypothetical protein
MATHSSFDMKATDASKSESVLLLSLLSETDAFSLNLDLPVQLKKLG